MLLKVEFDRELFKVKKLKQC